MFLHVLVVRYDGISFLFAAAAAAAAAAIIHATVF
jgi:hypothetical protein